MRLVLDAEAVNALLDPRHPAERKVRQAMEAATGHAARSRSRQARSPRPGRGAGRNQGLDALLARESGHGLLLRDTDRTLARLIGALLSEAGASSALLADAHPVAVAVEAGGGVVQTADPEDLGRPGRPMPDGRR
jgi:hypothetical protein